MIQIEPLANEEWLVTVTAASTRTQHRVHVTAAEAKRYGGETTVEQLLEASFRFLLEREPNSSILAEFDLSVISRYFPEYEGEIGRYLHEIDGGEVR